METEGADINKGDCCDPCAGVLQRELRELREAVDGLARRLDHRDDVAHETARGVARITEMLDKHAPLLERASRMAGAFRRPPGKGAG